MAEQPAGEFEKNIERLDQIVRDLENGTVGLDKSIELFKEGRDLAKRCDELLKALFSECCEHLKSPSWQPCVGRLARPVMRESTVKRAK